MRSVLRAALCGGLIAAACSGAPSAPGPALDPAVTAAPALATPLSTPPSALPRPRVDPAMAELAVIGPASLRPIEDLAPGVADLIAQSAGPIGVALVIPETGQVYVGGDQRPFALASAAKVPVLLAVLERAESEGRELTRREEQQIEAMITLSDNISTTSLWTSLGGGEGIERFLPRLDGHTFEWGSGNYWGDTAATPEALAALLASVLDGSALGIGEQAVALALLEAVAPDQRWGVSAGLNLAEGSGVRLGVKDGWYPDSGGWRLASTGIVRTEDGPDYALVILSDRQPEFEEGVWALERIAAEVHHALLPQPLTADLSLTEFPNPAAADSMVAAAQAEAQRTDLQGTQAPPGPTNTPTPAPAVAFRPLDGAPGVLVPTTAVPIAREQQEAGTSFWFHVPGASVPVLLQEYRSAMEQAGWSARDAGGGLVLTNGTGRVTVGAHHQPNQAVLNLVVDLPQASASAALERQ